MKLDKRMELRLEEKEKEKIKMGATILQISASRFVVLSALEMADKLIGNESKTE